MMDFASLSEKIKKATDDFERERQKHVALS
jgi:hypothetical protein